MKHKVLCAITKTEGQLHKHFYDIANVDAQRAFVCLLLRNFLRLKRLLGMRVQEVDDAQNPCALYVTPQKV
jgi:hypothetical protein